MQAMDDALLSPVVQAARDELQNPRLLSDRIAVGRALWRELVIGFAQQLGELDLGFTQLAALYAVAGTVTLTVADLAEQIGRSPSATTRIVSDLVDARLPGAQRGGRRPSPAGALADAGGRGAAGDHRPCPRRPVPGRRAAPAHGRAGARGDGRGRARQSRDDAARRPATARRGRPEVCAWGSVACAASLRLRVGWQQRVGHRAYETVLGGTPWSSSQDSCLPSPRPWPCCWRSPRPFSGPTRPPSPIRSCKRASSACPGHRHGGQDGQVRSRRGRRLAPGHQARRALRDVLHGRRPFLPQARDDSCASSASRVTACAACPWTSVPAASGPATAANYPGDAAADRDVLLTSRHHRRQRGPGLPDPGGRRAHRECRLHRLRGQATAGRGLAGAVLRQVARQAHAAQRRAAGRDARRSARSSALGDADRKGGIAVDASTDAVHVAWTAGRRPRPALHALQVSRRRAARASSAEAPRRWPRATPPGRRSATRGLNVVVAYTDDGKAKARPRPMAASRSHRRGHARATRAAWPALRRSTRPTSAAPGSSSRPRPARTVS